MVSGELGPWHMRNSKWKNHQYQTSGNVKAHRKKKYNNDDLIDRYPSVEKLPTDHNYQVVKP